MIPLFAVVIRRLYDVPPYVWNTQICAFSRKLGRHGEHAVERHGPGQAAAESAIAELRAKWQEAERPADFSTGRLGLLATEYG